MPQPTNNDDDLSQEEILILRAVYWADPVFRRALRSVYNDMGYGMPLEFIGLLLGGVSRQCVHAIEKQALAKIKRKLLSDKQHGNF